MFNVFAFIVPPVGKVGYSTERLYTHQCVLSVCVCNNFATLRRDPRYLSTLVELVKFCYETLLYKFCVLLQRVLRTVNWTRRKVDA